MKRLMASIVAAIVMIFTVPLAIAQPFGMTAPVMVHSTMYKVTDNMSPDVATVTQAKPDNNGINYTYKPPSITQVVADNKVIYKSGSSVGKLPLDSVVWRSTSFSCGWCKQNPTDV